MNEIHGMLLLTLVAVAIVALAIQLSPRNSRW